MTPGQRGKPDCCFLGRGTSTMITVASLLEEEQDRAMIRSTFDNIKSMEGWVSFAGVMIFIIAICQCVQCAMCIGVLK